MDTEEAITAKVMDAINRNCACEYSEDNALIRRCVPHSIMDDENQREQFVQRLAFERHERLRWIKAEHSEPQPAA